ncbi:hypothetical protein UPYG_G00227740 [Umbra pygmaea]|uniref:Ig-like domain-containing protein n=1 Tax=Umbra pygmaea TaxID=75934 RepID=A0ABD0WHU3_UMBPY
MYCRGSSDSIKDHGFLVIVYVFSNQNKLPSFTSDLHHISSLLVIITFITMLRVLLYLAALPVWVAGESLSSKVNQTPVSLIKEPGGNVKLSCSHTVPNYYMILWYQQSTGDTDMKLIGYAYTTSITLEPSFKNLFNISGDGGKEAYLDIPSLRQPEDSAVYYCGASKHSDVDCPLSSTKTLSESTVAAVLRTPASEVSV